MFTRKASGPAPASDDPVQAARLRARQRLVGAALLLVAGIVAFPLLFETKPRPLPLDTPIVAARAPGGTQAPGAGAPAPKPVLRAVPTAAPPAPAPAAAASAPVEAPAPVDAPPPAEPAASDAARVAAAAVAVAKAASAAAPAAKAAPVATPAAKAAPVATPAAKPAAVAAPAKPAAASAPVAAAAGTTTAATAAEAPATASAPRAARYVVQVGAFSEPTTARDVRSKVERLGLKTYTQVVDTDSGKRTRVRVGPFASREEAMQTLARIQAASLPGVVLAL